MEETDLLKNLDYPIKVKDDLTSKFHLNHNELQTGLTETELEQSIKLEEKEKEKKLIISTDPTIEVNTQLTQSSLTPEPNNIIDNKQENNIITNNQNIKKEPIRLSSTEVFDVINDINFEMDLLSSQITTNLNTEPKLRDKSPVIFKTQTNSPKSKSPPQAQIISKIIPLTSAQRKIRTEKKINLHSRTRQHIDPFAHFNTVHSTSTQKSSLYVKPIINLKQASKNICTTKKDPIISHKRSKQMNLGEINVNAFSEEK